MVFSFGYSKIMRLGFLTAMREDIEFSNEFMFKRIMSNLAPMYLAAYLEKRGIEIEVIIKDSLEELEKFCPQILGISSVTENIEFAKLCAKKAKESWNPFILLGGSHITALPKALPKDFDIGVIGEGEETLVELIAIFQKSQELKSEKLSQVRGISFHEGGLVKQTPFRQGVEPLDEIPYPARQKYLKHTGITYMMTSRGCPYTCSFCTIPMISNGYRMHSPAYVLEEIKSIKRYYPQVKHIRIFDDLYVVNRKRVSEIANLVEAEGLNQELSFGCWGRANLLNDEMMRAFKKMNMLYVAFGAESGSSRVLSKIKPGASIEENQNAIDKLYDAGIRVSCSVILGHPLEKEKDLWQTYDFIEKNLDKLFEVEFNVAIPWPGTELWQAAYSRGLVHEAMDFNILKECAYFGNYCTENHPYLNEHISPERFDLILSDFKKLFHHLQKKIDQSGLGREVNPEGGVAKLL